MPTINRQKFIEFLARNKSAAEFFIDLISRYSNVLDMDFIDQPGHSLSENESLPCSEVLIVYAHMGYCSGKFKSNC